MNRATKMTLIGIALFFAVVVLSFVWFVATWDREAEQPVTANPIPAEWIA